MVATVGFGPLINLWGLDLWGLEDPDQRSRETRRQGGVLEIKVTRDREGRDRSSPGLEHPSKNSSENGIMALSRLGFSPSGGSLVSLIHTCQENQAKTHLFQGAAAHR